MDNFFVKNYKKPEEKINANNVSRNMFCSLEINSMQLQYYRLLINYEMSKR